ncbi:endonuclease domain-containing protein [Gellertiella hungarica]|uniref:Very-short-patch-repair endonuclease n=1 Tax=Gellertiella hungarica TaxID=1572859 RepID=A0A7W6J893_9HYPH|nr:endonuclease domain-containing protein [Gellertiella hungarica]MBB4065733.1 very-short-patch-repair endonuclease [Gellertiella hungarica]
MPSHHPVSPERRKNARRMRKGMTDAELAFWNAVRAHRLENLHFRRQMPILGYVVDFACPEKRLIVEFNGCHHALDPLADADRHRDRALARAGWTVLRFWNHEVLEDCAGVCRHVLITVGIPAF